MIKKLFLYFNVIAFHLSAQYSLLDSLLNTLPLDTRNILEQANNYRLQIIYTKINYSEDGQVHFEDYFFNYSDSLYNYPASMVKLPASIVALKKISILHNKGIDWNSKLLMDSLFCQKALINDSIGSPAYPHLHKWIKRMLIISDNEAYTHTYDFINCKTFHQWLYQWGFDKAQIKHKFISKCINDSTYYTPTIYILNEKQDTLYIQYQDSACKFSTLNKNYSIGYTIKTIKQKRKRIRIKEPKVFVKHNDWPLFYSHQLLKYLIFDDELKILDLPKNYKDSLIKFMGSYPREYPDLQVDTTNYYDTWKKFFMYGGKYKRVKEDTLRSINIIGRAYGFLSETAYIVDFKNNIHFLISASIYVNPNNLMDGKYNYELAYQLFYQISRLIYDYEKTQIKTSPKIRNYEQIFKNQK
ncbi:MAG: hypothetical protein N3F62_09885 [Bacteroidia bacterium]|nr:hypothetical protein [Bacteroidia bacterium]